jgi:hypothetical protein
MSITLGSMVVFMLSGMVLAFIVAGGLLGMWH